MCTSHLGGTIVRDNDPKLLLLQWKLVCGSGVVNFCVMGTISNRLPKVNQDAEMTI